MLTHVLPHAVWPGGHVHAPAVQVAPVGHTWPQEPQFVKDVCVFTHVVPHTSGVAPVQMQAPATHIAVGGHALPHVPQFAVLV